MNVPPTQIGTSDPVSICDGLPIFPPINIKLGKQFSGTFFEEGVTVLALRLNASAGYGLFFGLCGPAWALKMQAEGEATQGSIGINVSEDELAVGLLLGASFNLSLSVQTQYYDCDWEWWGPEDCGWRSGLTVTLSLGIDLISLVKEAISYLLGKGAADKTLKPVPEKLGLGDVLGVGIQSYGLFDGGEGLFAKNDGKMQVRPTFQIPIDLWPLACKAYPPAEAARQALKAAQCSFGFGPSFGIQIPVTLKMNRIMLGSTTYSDLQVVGARVTGTSSGPDPSGSSTLTVEFAQTPGLDFYVGVFASFSVFKVLSISVECGLAILQQFGITIDFATHYQPLQSSLGQTLAAGGCAPCDIEYGLVDVVFE